MAERFLFKWRHALASEEGPSEPMDRGVALVMSLYMTSDGYGAWPSQETLAARTGLARRSVWKSLERLCNEKWLERQPRKSPRGVRHKRFGYEYRARLPKRLAEAYLNGARRALFTGKDPRRLPTKKNCASDDTSIVHPVLTNTSGECIKHALQSSTALTAKEIEDLDAFIEKPPI